MRFLLAAAFLTGIGWLGGVVFTAAVIVTQIMHMRSYRRDVRRRMRAI
jgi:hypothetical protein